MAELIPSSGTRLIDTLTSNYTTKSITTDLLTPVWTWELVHIDNAPPEIDVIDVNFAITTSNVLQVSYFDKINLYPIQRLSYTKTNYESVTITSLSQLPKDPLESPFIHEYRVSGKNYLEWRLDVSVTGTEIIEDDDSTGTGGTGGGSTSKLVTLSGSYIIRVNTDYNEHINILRGLLDQRKNY